MTTLLEKWKVIVEMAADPDITRGELAAAVVLFDHMNGNGVVQIGHATIAENTGQKIRSAKYSTDGLVAKRYFEQIGHGGPGCPNRYRRPEAIRMMRDGQPNASGCPSSCEMETHTSPQVGQPSAPHNDEVGQPSAPRVGQPSAPPDHGVGQSSAPYGATQCPTVGHPIADIPSYPLIPKKELSKPKATKADFEELRLIWPSNRRDGLTGALSEYQRALKRGKTHAALMEAGRVHVTSCAPQFCVGLRRWLRDGYYDQGSPSSGGDMPSAQAESYAAKQLRKLQGGAA